jgi:hypothetical protein
MWLTFYGVRAATIAMHHSVNTFQQQKLCFLYGRCGGYITRIMYQHNRFQFLSDSDKVESPGGLSSWAYKDENGACDLKTLIMYNIWSVWLSETVLASVLRSVTRRRLVKTENPSACATVKWKVCKSAIALYCLYLSAIKRDFNQSANKSNHPSQNPSFSSRIPSYTWQYYLQNRVSDDKR